MALHGIAGMVDRVANFGNWPPTEAYAKAFKATGLLFNLQDPALSTPAKAAAQIAGARTHIGWVGVWYPVPGQAEQGAQLADQISRRIGEIDAELGKQGEPKVSAVWLNFESFGIDRWREFLWGRPGVKGWRGIDGRRGSSSGLRPGLATGAVDQPFQDGSVVPHAELMEARLMYAVEGFYGPTSDWPDMTPADHPQALLDRVRGARAGGTVKTEEAYPFEQVVGCYDAALGRVVNPAEPLLIRSGLHFTLERARQAQII